MNAEIFSEWLRLQGSKVVTTPNGYWYEASPKVFQAFPYHRLIQPTETELSELLKKNRAICLRYSAPMEHPEGKVSYHAIYDKPDYTLEGLDRRTRQNIRKGLKNCQVESISFERLASEGWLLEKDTQARHDRNNAVDEQTWIKRCMAAKELPGFEAWGAIVEGRLVASLLSFQCDDCCELITQQCHHDYMPMRVNNALCFTVTQTMVSRPSVRFIYYTMQSLDAPPSIDEFKFRMGYSAKPLRQRVVFNPWISRLANPTSLSFVKWLCTRYPSNPRIPKAEGMIRFYLEGKLPQEEQRWPDCLHDQQIIRH